MAAGKIVGSSVAARALAANPLSVAGGVFVTTQAMAAKITKFFDAGSLPEDVTLNAVGYLTEDGPTREVSRDTEQHKAWGGDTLLTTYEGAEATVSLPCAEYLNPVGQRLLYGDANVTYSAGDKTLTINGVLNALPPHVAVVVMVDTDSAQGVIVYDDAQAAIDGEVTMDGKSVMALEITLNLRPVNGKFFREYWKVKPNIETGLV